MKLHVLCVRDPRSRAMGHCETITSGTDWICRVSVDATQASGRQDRHLGKIPVYGLLRTIKYVRTMTGNWSVVIEWVARAMWKCYEVGCCCVCLDTYVVVIAKRRDQSLGYCHSREIANVQNATSRMCSFLSPDRFA